MKSSLRMGLLVMVAVAGVYCLPASLRPIAIPDESRYGEIPREMVESGDWVVPRLNGLRYFEKPVLGYWIHAASLVTFGVNPFAIRLPSVLGTLLTALMIGWLLRRTIGDPEAALLAAVVFVTSFLVFVIGQTAVLDMLTTMFLTATLGLFYTAMHESGRGRCRLFLGLCGACCGMAFLTKGFIAFAVPAVVIVPYLAWERRWKALVTAPWIPLLAIVAISLPWALMIHRQEPDFWRYFFWVEHVNRYFGGEAAQHSNPAWYFVPVLVAGGVPWTPLWAAAWKGVAVVAPEARSLRRFAICWAVFPFLFFSASSGKLGTYILPCFPALALLTGWGVVAGLRKGSQAVFNRGALALSGVVGVGALALVGVHSIGPESGRYFRPEETREWIVLSVSLLVWALLCLQAARTTPWQKKVMLYCLGPAPIFLSLVAQPAQLSVTRNATEFLDLYAARVPEQGVLVSDSTLVHSTCLYFERDDVFLIRYRGELEYGLRPPEASGRFLEPQEFAAMIRDNEGGAPITVVIEANRFEAYRPHLPPPTFERADIRVVDKDRLLFLQFGEPVPAPNPPVALHGDQPVGPRRRGEPASAGQSTY